MAILENNKPTPKRKWISIDVDPYWYALLKEAARATNLKIGEALDQLVEKNADELRMLIGPEKE